MAARMDPRLPVGAPMTDDDDLDGLKCLVSGCDFHVEMSDRWHEELEQHVRWLHVRTMDFGDQPIPSLFGLLSNGLIRVDEFAQFSTEIVGAAFDSSPPSTAIARISRSIKLLMIGGLAGVVIQVGLFLSILKVSRFGFNVAQAASLVLFGCLYLMGRLVVQRDRSSVGSVRVLTYPDIKESDGGEGEANE